jgi:uncharacterized protein (DUF3820 family)
MTTRKFINDWHTIISFGRHKGSSLLDVPKEYRDWILDKHKYGNEYEALIRITNRVSVTSVIKDQNMELYIPELIKDTTLPKIIRPNHVDAALFGSFVEYFVKYQLGIKKFDEVCQYLAIYGLVNVPAHLKLEGVIQKPDKRVQYIARSFNKKLYDPTDLCNLSFCHALLLNHYNEEDGKILYNYVKDNATYFLNYAQIIQTHPTLPKLLDDQQNTTDKISVGCVIGVIDIITDTCIVDIKCCSKDDITYYRKQMFAYACLHRLRYGNIMTHSKIFNFLTGNSYTMHLSDIPDESILKHIKNMGSHCEYHTKLFN